MMNNVLNSQIQLKINTYPEAAREKFSEIRDAIIQVAAQESLGGITESIKWNEPSYQLDNPKLGSAIRIDWKERSPDTISVYFNCKTLLIETFKEIYRDIFNFVGNREIVFQLSDSLPMPELKACVSMALRYHQIKHLPLLGE